MSEFEWHPFSNKPIAQPTGFDKYGNGPVLNPGQEIAGKNFTYMFNSDGLRSKEFNTKPNIIALGCSFTIGTGLESKNTWPMILETKMNKLTNKENSVGVIAYNGGSIMKMISSLFNVIKTYNYLPEYIVCNFPSPYRFYYFDVEKKHLVDTHVSEERIKKDSYPFHVEKILPHEWVSYLNMEYIKMLEIFCKHNDINLTWTTYSDVFLGGPQEDVWKFISNEFDNYVDDITKPLFPKGTAHNFSEQKISTLKLPEDFEMINWKNIKCHEKEYNEFGRYHFNCGYDNEPFSLNGGYPQPHAGVHRQIHWAEMFLDYIINKDNRGII